MQVEMILESNGIEKHVLEALKKEQVVNTLYWYLWKFVVWWFSERGTEKRKKDLISSSRSVFSDL